jgi:hypothetical protein
MAYDRDGEIHEHRIQDQFKGHQDWRLCPCERAKRLVETASLPELLTIMLEWRRGQLERDALPVWLMLRFIELANDANIELEARREVERVVREHYNAPDVLAAMDRLNEILRAKGRTLVNVAQVQAACRMERLGRATT